MGEKSNKNSFNLNINENKIIYNENGLLKLSKDDNIILNARDPLGNQIVLWEYTFYKHILGEPHSKSSRHYLDSTRNMQRIKKGISAPHYIIEDKDREDRFEYMVMTDIEQDGITRIKGLSIITEISESIENSLEVVTIVPKSNISTNISGRRMIYNVNGIND